MDSRFAGISTPDIYAELVRREEQLVVHVADIPNEFFKDLIEAYTREDFRVLTEEERLATQDRLKNYIAVDTRPFGSIK